MEENKKIIQENKYSWNQTLKFSWGHIIAFVSLIFISYVMYMGTFYQNGGDFTSAAIKVALIDLFLLIAFIGAQILKGTDEKFDRCIIFERVLICLCPIAFICAMIPYNHFWSVFEQRKQIESQFNSSIEGAKQMFVSYDKYAEERIKVYENNLDSILIVRASGDATLYGKAGFTGTNDHVKKANFVHTLDLQLRSQNTDSLRFVALKWIDDANQGATVWNAFLVGNVKQISDAIKSWHSTLQSYSETKMSNESLRGNEVLVFDENGRSIEVAMMGIKLLKEIYTNTSGVKMHTVWTGIIIFLMLLFPYFLQKRNTRAEGLYFLIPGKKAKSHKKTISSLSKSTETNDTSNDVIDSKSTSASQSSNNDDIFGGTF